MKNVMQKVMLYLCSLIITLRFNEKIFCKKCALYCEIVKFDRIDLSGTPCTHLEIPQNYFTFRLRM